METDEEHCRPLTGTPQGDKNSGAPSGQMSSPTTPEPPGPGPGGLVGPALSSLGPLSPAPGPEVLLMRPDSAKASPPALPPRPRVPGASGGRPAVLGAGAGVSGRCRPGGGSSACWRPGSGGGLRKYVFLCAACGGLSSLLGILFLAVYFMLRSYTSSLSYFETVPTYVPASMLISTGVVVMCLARRRNRYSFLMKLCGCSCLASAALCVLVTVATTVVHMSRLQSLNQCSYREPTRSCVCYAGLTEDVVVEDPEEGIRYEFQNVYDCSVIHGSLYSCLRAMFGLSVVGILVCIFSGMLVYQLFSHEKKKMYWEQLELRCRYLYRRPTHAPHPSHQHQVHQPAHHLPLHAAHPAHHCGSCSCCDDCRDLHTPSWELMDSRYWAPGRVGNLYSPNPEDQHAPSVSSTGASVGLGPASRESVSAWSWRRLPWGRSTSRAAADQLCVRPRPQNVASPDSQYGFNAPGADLSRGLGTAQAPVGPYLLSQVYPTPQPHPRPFAPSPDGIHLGGHLGAHLGAPLGGALGNPMGMGGVPLPLAVPMPLSLTDGLGEFYIWGPPPPYVSNPASAANSPARREVAQVQPQPVSSLLPRAARIQAQVQTTSAADRPLSTSTAEDGNASAQDSMSSPEKTVPRKKRKKAHVDSHTDASLDSEVQQHLQAQLESPDSPTPRAPVALTGSRKAKKRCDAPAPPGSRQASRYACRASRSAQAQRPSSADSCCVEGSPCCSRSGEVSDDVDTEGYSYPRLKFPPQGPATQVPPTAAPATDSQAILAAFDNQAFQEGVSDVPAGAPVKTVTLGPQGPLVCKKRPSDPSESEVYFGDDSSCCNVSEQHSSLTYDDADRPGRAFKLVHSHLQQRSMDGGPYRPTPIVHRPTASTLSDSAASTPYRLHPIDTDTDERDLMEFGRLRQRMPLPLPNPPQGDHEVRSDERDRLSLAPDAQYESIADSNVYTYISPLPLVHHVTAESVSPTRVVSVLNSSRRQFRPSCDSPHKSESVDDNENAVNAQREKLNDSAKSTSPEEAPGIDL